MWGVRASVRVVVWPLVSQYSLVLDHGLAYIICIIEIVSDEPAVLGVLYSTASISVLL